MSWPILLLIQTSIGALIGGVTNELAIRMLFRPYKPVYIGKWRVPFTPGLIPKRHEELAEQMGKLVENFLITPEGVRKMFRRGGWEEEAVHWLMARLSELERSDETVRAFLKHWGIDFSEDRLNYVKHTIELYLARMISRASGVTLEEALPDEWKEVLEAKIEELAPLLLDKVGQYLVTQEGTEMVRQMLSQLTGGLGMLGGFASMLLSDEKVAGKVSSSLESALRSEGLKEKVRDILVKEWRNLYGKQIGEIIQWIGEKRVEKAIRCLVDRFLDGKALGEKKVGSLVSPLARTIRETLPGIVHRLFEWVETHLETGLKKINLTHIAAAEVANFPVHKLEEMIVHITGKELKMITVFGAILGGLIGLFQGLLVFFAQ